MAGTKTGGLKARDTNKRNHGEDFYKRIGSKGGASGNTGGFKSNKIGRDGLTGRERARVAGAVGGRISRRGASAPKEALPEEAEITSLINSGELDLTLEGTRLETNEHGGFVSTLLRAVRKR